MRVRLHDTNIYLSLVRENRELTIGVSDRQIRG